MKSAIVVGATSGIGKGIARLLTENEFKVGITGRRTGLLIEIQNEKPDSYFIKTFDISETRNIRDHFTDLSLKMGGLDLLIISAGTGDLNDKLDFEIEKRTIDINVSGFTAIADWGFNYFKKQGYGHLAAITSVGGLRGSHQAPSYSASKAYQINYLEGLRQKAAKLSYPIDITDIRAGFVNTNMAKGEGIFWLSTVEKASKQIFNAVKARKKVVYITRRWRIIAIILKNLPGWIYDKI